MVRLSIKIFDDNNISFLKPFFLEQNLLTVINSLYVKLRPRDVRIYFDIQETTPVVFCRIFYFQIAETFTKYSAVVSRISSCILNANLICACCQQIVFIYVFSTASLHFSQILQCLMTSLRAMSPADVYDGLVKKIKVAQSAMERAILVGVSKDRIRNETILERTKVTNIVTS